MKQKAKRSAMNNGITLIALIVTIIVLLILAGVTINMAVNQNGIFKRAQNATTAYKLAEASESQGLQNATDEMDKYAKQYGLNQEENSGEIYSKLYDTDGDENGDLIVLANDNKDYYEDATSITMVKDVGNINTLENFNTFNIKNINNKDKYLPILKNSGETNGINTDYICKVRIQNKIYPTSCRGMFAGLSSIETIEGMKNINTKNVTDISCMFEKCSKLATIDLSNFNTSNVTDMSSMFELCDKLENIYVSIKWNVENVTSSEKMFKYCESLPNYNSSSLDKSKANTSSTGYLTLKS